MDVYLNNKKYQSQEQTQKAIGVDTARDMICVDGRQDIIHTGEYGYWGDVFELYHHNKDKKVSDAVILVFLCRIIKISKE